MEKLNLPQKYIDYLNTIIPGGYNDLISLENKVIADKVMKAYRDCLSYDGTEKLFIHLICHFLPINLNSLYMKLFKKATDTV